MTINLWMIWLIVAIILVIVEVFTTSAIALCLAIGAFAASVVAFCGVSIELQLLVLAIAMIASLILVPRLLKRYKGLFVSGKDAVSNMDALVGRSTVVEFPIAGSSARVKIDGDSWQVKTADGSELKSAERVKVCGYDSIVLIVEKI